MKIFHNASVVMRVNKDRVPQPGTTGTTGTNSTQQVVEDYHTEDFPQRGPQNAPTINYKKETRSKWTREEYMEVMEAYS